MGMTPFDETETDSDKADKLAEAFFHEQRIYIARNEADRLERENLTLKETK